MFTCPSAYFFSENPQLFQIKFGVGVYADSCWANLILFYRPVVSIRPTLTVHEAEIDIYRYSHKYHTKENCA